MCWRRVYVLEDSGHAEGEFTCWRTVYMLEDGVRAEESVRAGRQRT